MFCLFSYWAPPQFSVLQVMMRPGNEARTDLSCSSVMQVTAANKRHGTQPHCIFAIDNIVRRAANTVLTIVSPGQNHTIVPPVMYYNSSLNSFFLFVCLFICLFVCLFFLLILDWRRVPGHTIIIFWLVEILLSSVMAI